MIDKKANRFIECKYVQIIRYDGGASSPGESNIEKAIPPHNKIVKLNLLEKWSNGRAQAINSDFYKLTLRIDLNIHERFVNFSTQNKEAWYGLNTDDHLDIHFFIPTFVSLGFNTWELKGKMILNTSNGIIVLKDENNSFEIHAKNFDAEEFGKNYDEYVRLGTFK